MTKWIQLALCICILLGCGAQSVEVIRERSTGESVQEARFSVWYWLNAVPKTQWREDFSAISKNGFTHVILCWGYDLSAFRLRKQDSLEALELCRQNRLGAYLLIWHPIHNSLLLEAEAEHFQIDNLGNKRFSFNLFSRDWRNSQWKSYLQDIAQTYKGSEAFDGYALDDSFAFGPVSTFSGLKGVEAGDFVSYSEADRLRFREWLKSRYHTLSRVNEQWGITLSDWTDIEIPMKIESEPIWADWTDARTDWLEDWARDTMRFIREVDPDPAHIVYIEDLARVLGLESTESRFSTRPVTFADTIGLRFGRVTRHFDRLGAYTMPSSWDSEDALDRALEQTDTVLEETIRQAGGVDQLTYTFWISDSQQVFSPGPVTRPTAEEIWKISELALSKGINHIDYYAFDVGGASLDDDEDWKRHLPGTKVDYPLSKQFRKTWLKDRPGGVLEELGGFVKAYRGQ
jgi:hypothetical protein